MTNEQTAIKKAVKTLTDVLADLKEVDTATDIANAPAWGDHSKEAPVKPTNPLPGAPFVEPPVSELPPAPLTTGVIPLVDEDAGKLGAKANALPGDQDASIGKSKAELKADAKADADLAKEDAKAAKGK